MAEPLTRRLTAEAVGSFFLLAAVVGSGVMGARLASGNVALALLANTLATGAILIVLVHALGPISGAHLNPAVSFISALRGDLLWRDLAPYIAAQCAGAVLGVWAAHVMFDLPLLQLSTTPRSGAAQWFSETVATFGLVFVILSCIERAPTATPYAVGLYIASAYWFTASTSFANPAVTIARALSDTFAGIRPADVAPFIVAQFVGAASALLLTSQLESERKPNRKAKA